MRLKSLKILNNTGKIIYDVSFLGKEHKERSGPFISVVIGANGTGKSFLLNQITELFAHYNKKKYKWPYSLYEAEIIGKKSSQKIIIDSKKQKEKYFNMPINFNVLAVSYTINDKFLFQKDNFDSCYKYLGIRQSSNASFSSNVERKIVEILINLAVANSKTEEIKSIFNYLQWRNSCILRIRLKKSMIKKFDLNIVHVIKEKIKKLETSVKYKKLFFMANNFEKKIIYFIDGLKKNQEIRIDLFQPLSLEFDLKLFDLLNALELINYDILVQKGSNEFCFSWASSGEKQLFFTFLNILANIKTNSLVLIDEPEISLHPNWQIGYIDFLKKLFKNYDCHFIVATHSHYLVSDLEARSSSLVKLKRNEKQILPAIPEEINTYAWSAENVLYDVFGAITSRNRFVAEDLASIFERFVEQKDTGIDINNRDREKLVCLNRSLKSQDPLKGVVEALLEEMGKQK